MSSDQKNLGKTESADSPKVTLKECLDSGKSSICFYKGVAYPPLSEKCIPDDEGVFTIHICIDGKWVSTGEECEPDE